MEWKIVKICIWNYLIANIYIVWNILLIQFKEDINKYQEGNSVNDIIVCMYKSSTMENNIQEPDVVCRQNISDLYYNYQIQD